MKLTESFRVLRDHFGTHNKAALALSLSIRSYTQYRTSTIPDRVSRYVRLWAWMIQTGQQPDDLEFFNPEPAHRSVDSL